jgi:hypothetical protein
MFHIMHVGQAEGEEKGREGGAREMEGKGGRAGVVVEGGWKGKGCGCE